MKKIWKKNSAIIFSLGWAYQPGLKVLQPNRYIVATWRPFVLVRNTAGTTKVPALHEGATDCGGRGCSAGLSRGAWWRRAADRDRYKESSSSMYTGLEAEHRRQWKLRGQFSRRKCTIVLSRKGTAPSLQGAPSGGPQDRRWSKTAADGRGAADVAGSRDGRLRSGFFCFQRKSEKILRDFFAKCNLHSGFGVFSVPEGVLNMNALLPYNNECFTLSIRSKRQELYAVRGSSDIWPIVPPCNRSAGQKLNSCTVRCTELTSGQVHSKIWYFFRSILLFTNTDISITKICLNTSIFAKSYMGRRKYFILHGAH
jgi:hypothetical protein